MVDQAIAAIEFGNAGVLPGAGGEGVRASHAQTGVGNISDSNYRGGRGLDPEVIAEITHRYGFDKPIHERYFKMLWDYIRFDFGDSLFRSASVLTLIKDSLPVSITLGLWSTLIIYLVSIPLGIRKAVYNGSRFDVWSSAFIIIGYAIPAFLFAILLIVVLGGVGSITGSVISAIAVTVAMEALRFLDGPLNLGIWETAGTPGMRMVFFSVLLMLVIIFRQRGLMGTHEFSWDSLAKIGLLPRRKADAGADDSERSA